jgi:Asp/Glu/hydantoin racemase
MRVGLIRALSTTDRRLLHAHGRLLHKVFGYEVTSRCIPDQPDGVHDAASYDAAGPKVAELAREMAGGVDALIISCAADPGLEETRAVVGIPVVGAGSAAAAAALAYGGRVGVLGLKRPVPTPISSALGERMVLLDGPDGVETSNGFLLPTGIFNSLSEAQMLAEAGADVILQASTGLSSIGMAEVLRRKLGLPVIDAVTAAGSVLSAAVSMRAPQPV